MSAPADKVTKADLENRFRALQTGAVDKAEQARGSIAKAGVGVGLLLLLIAYLLGRRKGKRKTTLVEIRRL